MSRRLTLHQTLLDRTDAVTKCEHLKTPTPCVTPIVMTAKCIGYVDSMKSEARHPEQNNSCPHLPAYQWQFIG